MPTTPPTRDPAPQDFDSLLSRPPEQRVREFKYRFAQSMIFGLPVVGLELYGRALGGREADRWVMLLQFLLAGWVMYVGAAGMLSEGLLLLPRRRSPDLAVSIGAIGMYLAGAISFAGVITAGFPRLGRGWFAWAVALIALWTGIRWGWLAGRPPRANPPA